MTPRRSVLLAALALATTCRGRAASTNAAPASQPSPEMSRRSSRPAPPVGDDGAPP
jgi:hypothetical protein